MNMCKLKNQCTGMQAIWTISLNSGCLKILIKFTKLSSKDNHEGKRTEDITSIRKEVGYHCRPLR